MGHPLSRHRLFRRRDCRDFAAFAAALDGHAVRARLLHGRKEVAVTTGGLTVDLRDRDVAVRLSISATTFLIEPGCFRMAVYSPPPEDRLVITMFDSVPLTLVVSLDGGEDDLGMESDDAEGS